MSVSPSNPSSISPSSQSPARPLSGRARVLTVGAVTLGAFIALLNQTVMSPALPNLMRDFAVSEGTVQWVTSIYMLVSGIMVPISAYFIDRFTTRRLFFASMGLFIAGTALGAFAPGFGVLILGRVLQAAGSGILMPLVAVVPMLVYPPERRGMAMGVAGIVMAAGPSIGPVVGGAVIDSLGWRAMFLGIAAVGAAILAAGAVMLHNVGELRHPRLSVSSVILSTVAFGGLLYGFSTASDAGWTSPMVIVPIAVGVVAFVAFAVQQIRLREPLVEVRTLATADFRNAAIVVTLINASVAVTNVSLPLLLQNGMGVSATVTGAVMLPAALVGLVMSPVSGALFDRFGARWMAIGGTALMVLAMGSMGLFAHRGSSVALVATLCGLQGLGQALANMPVNTWGINALPDAMIAHGNAIANTGRQVFGAISTALIVTVMSGVQAGRQSAGAAEATVAGVSASYVICAAIALVAMIWSAVTVRDRRREPVLVPVETHAVRAPEVPVDAPATPRVDSAA